MAHDADVIVVGGGAAGIVAAVHAAKVGRRVVLLEKNHRLGMKILISGGGKCNLTHDGPMEELRSTFRAEEARFLKPSFYKYTNLDFLDMLHRRGMSTYVRPDGRVFPVEPADAKTVVRLLTDVVLEHGVDVRFLTSVTGVLTKNGAVTGVATETGELNAPNVIVAVGGSSYPATGTTGDGWRWMKEIGHTVVPLRAALAPISLVDAKPEWAGVALRDVCLKGRVGKNGKEFVKWNGDLLYTHKGISGPAALGVSREVAERLVESSGQTEPFLEVDLEPNISFEDLRDRLRSEATANPRRTVQSLVERFVPSRLLPTLLTLGDVDPLLRCNQLPARTLNRLVLAIKEWPLGPPSGVPLERGEVVAGGVELAEVDPQTMQSRKIAGLYLCGEILNIAGPVGGYNLQAAWSTGYTAGISVLSREPDQ